MKPVANLVSAAACLLAMVVVVECSRAAGSFAADSLSVSDVDYRLGRSLLGQTVVQGAVDTTFADPAQCKGGSAINCNVYKSKEGVYTSGGPTQSQLSDGVYVYIVMEPGGNNQDIASDQSYVPTAQNRVSSVLSSDDYRNRIFRVVDGAVTYPYYTGPRETPQAPDHLTATSTVDASREIIQLMPYDDSTNGEYKLAACNIEASLGALDQCDLDGCSQVPAGPLLFENRYCKTDNFRINPDDVDLTPSSPTITKTATGSYTLTYPWTITKDVSVDYTDPAAAVATYTVTVTKGAAVTSAVSVAGKITVSNPNYASVDINSLSDTLSDDKLPGCTVTNPPTAGSPDTILSTGSADYAYSCDLSTLTSKPADTVTNAATVGWGPQKPSGYSNLAGASASVTGVTIDWTATTKDNCVSVTDAYNGGSAEVLDAEVCDTTTLDTYTQTIVYPEYGCQTYTNVATLTTADNSLTSTDSESVTVCGKCGGAHTRGFWTSPNGVYLINAMAPGSTSVCPITLELNKLAPFSIPTEPKGSCSAVNTYVSQVMSLGNAKDMRDQLRAQMLSTALSVYFTSGKPQSTLYKKYNEYAEEKLGDKVIDLTKIKTQGGSVIDASAAFGGAKKLSVQCLLDYAASKYTSLQWYGPGTADVMRNMQSLAKDTFDAINNQRAKQTTV